MGHHQSSLASQNTQDPCRMRIEKPHRNRSGTGRMRIGQFRSRLDGDAQEGDDGDVAAVARLGSTWRNSNLKGQKEDDCHNRRGAPLENGGHLPMPWGRYILCFSAIHSAGQSRSTNGQLTETLS